MTNPPPCQYCTHPLRLGETVEPPPACEAAVKKMKKQGLIGDTNQWQALEYLAAEYLAERG